MKKQIQKSTFSKFMTGTLRFVNYINDELEPTTFKEFKSHRDFESPPCTLTRGNIITKNNNVEQHIIFDCYEPYYEQTSSFKLFLYKDGTVSGKISYPIQDETPKQDFKGHYKLKSNSEIIIWGIWFNDVAGKEKYPSYLELNK